MPHSVPPPPALARIISKPVIPLPLAAWTLTNPLANPHTAISLNQTPHRDAEGSIQSKRAASVTIPWKGDNAFPVVACDLAGPDWTLLNLIFTLNHNQNFTFNLHCPTCRHIWITTRIWHLFALIPPPDIFHAQTQSEFGPYPTPRHIHAGSQPEFCTYPLLCCNRAQICPWVG